MTRAEICIPRILEHEGGFVDHPSDPGGATNKGITIATFRRFVKPTGNVADLKALTTAQAVVVYKRQYWDAVMADMLPFGLDFAMADYAVNSGPRQAVRDLQRVLGVTDDGQIGPQTIAAARAMDTKSAIRQLCARRLALMRGLRGGKLWATFGKGWQRRVDRVVLDALQDTKTPATNIGKASPAKTLWQTIWQIIMSLLGGAK
tara:strand:- start:522 stop:1133 length:612 start_codon:yes stop_codon:yes gene_type:complete